MNNMKKVKVKEFKGIQAFVKPGNYELVFYPNLRKLNIIGINTNDIVTLDKVYYVYGKENKFSIDKGQVLAFMLERKNNLFGKDNYQLEIVGW